MDYKKQSVNYYEIEKESFRCSEPTIYEIMWDGVKFEILINYKKESEYATVFGTGNVNKTLNKELPVFSRRTWMDEFSCTGIWYFDPTLYLKNDLTLAWYYGTNERWYLKDIAELIKIILNKLDIKISNTLFYGSSGGGFSSIMLATMFHGKATVVNPQLDATQYNEYTLQTLADSVLNDGEELIIERLKASDFIKKEKFFPVIHIYCNSFSKNDAKVQIPAFLSDCFDYNLDCSERFKVDFYYNVNGHGGMPEKADCVQHVETDVRKELPITISLDSQLQKDRIVLNVKTEPAYEDVEYEYHLYGTEKTKLHNRKLFSGSNSHSFMLIEDDIYTVTACARHKNPQTGLYTYHKATAQHDHKSPLSITVNTEINANKLSVRIDAKSDCSQIEYACYLYSTENSTPITRLRYQQEPYFDFELPYHGEYYTKTYIKLKNSADDEQIISKFTPLLSFE